MYCVDEIEADDVNPAATPGEAGDKGQVRGTSDSSSFYVIRLRSTSFVLLHSPRVSLPCLLDAVYSGDWLYSVVVSGWSWAESQPWGGAAGGCRACKPRGGASVDWVFRHADHHAGID